MLNMWALMRENLSSCSEQVRLKPTALLQIIARILDYITCIKVSYYTYQRANNNGADQTVQMPGGCAGSSAPLFLQATVRFSNAVAHVINVGKCGWYTDFMF